MSSIKLGSFEIQCTWDLASKIIIFFRHFCQKNGWCFTFLCVSGHVLHMALESIGLPWVIFQTGCTTGTWGFQISLGWPASEAQASGCLFPPHTGVVGTRHHIWSFTRVSVTEPFSCLRSDSSPDELPPRQRFLYFFSVQILSKSCLTQN